MNTSHPPPDTTHIEVEQSGVTLDLHLCEPDHSGWHLRISDAQVTTCHLLPLDAKGMDVRWEIVRHLARKAELAQAN